jgi:DNA-binding NarL/FixJ family response regulator
MKNYLEEELSPEEKVYLKKIIISARNNYIEKNSKYIKNEFVPIEDIDIVSIEQEDMSNIENFIDDISNIHRVFTNEKIANIAKQFSGKEKKVLLSLYHQKTINEIAQELGIYRGTVREIRNNIKRKLEKED